MSYKKKMNLFYVLKLNTSFIVKNGFNISLEFNEAKKNGLIIALGDNQLLKFIRQVKDIDFNKEMIDDLYSKRNYLKQISSSKDNGSEITNIQNKIDELLFVPDLLSIKTDTTKKDYKSICRNGFIVHIKINDKEYEVKYKRICAGAGQLRRNSALFVNQELYDRLEDIMMCGLTRNKIGKMNLAKFSAYYALYTSATNQITTPKICVVKDFEYVLKDQKVSWIYDNNGEKDIEERTIDFNNNAFDGGGMVSVEMAEKWGRDLFLDYTPSSFILRSAWIKGLVSVFDFKAFAKEIAHKDVIIDAWGNEKRVEDIDVILTTSQFKMWKKYSSWEEYIHFHRKYHHIFGVARTNKKEDNFVTTLNYQYIQSNDFNEDRIKNLANFSIEWLRKIMTGDKLYTMLFLIGCQDEDSSADDIEVKLDSCIAKTLMYNDSILNDTYIRQKVTQMLDKKINQLKIGKLLVEGSYDFAIPDLYAMAEHAFGLEVKGLLKAKECWNRRWVEKGSKVVSMMRSPLVAPSENQLLNIYSDDNCLKWFSHVKSGNIMNIWDLAMIRCSDADYDGDIVLVSDNKYLVNSVVDNARVITYEKKKAKEQYINFNNFANMDTKSFNSKIGFITNLASNFIAMLPNYNIESDEYKELKKRIDLLRFYQGSAIDATKGDIFTPPPKHWSKKQTFVPITDDMTDKAKNTALESNKVVAFNNRICGNKKPYFFGYVYPKFMKEQKNHVKVYNQISEIKYGEKIKGISKKENKSDSEKHFIRNFYKYMPLLTNNCTMNILAKYVEDAEFDNKYKTASKPFDYNILMSEKYQITDKDLLKKITDVIKKFNSEYAMRAKERNMLEYEYADNDYESVSEDIYYSYMFDSKENELFALCSNVEKLTNYVIYVYYTMFNNKSKSLLWTTFGEQILSNVKNKSDKCYYPVECEDGEEYLGKKYILKELDNYDI